MNVKSKMAAYRERARQVEAEIRSDPDYRPAVTVSTWREFREAVAFHEEAKISLPPVPRVAAGLSGQIGPQGAYLTEPQLGALVEVGLAASPVRRVGQVIRTATGSPYHWPAMNPGASSVGEGEILPESTSSTEADPTFSQMALHSYKFGSKKVFVPSELFEDGQDRLLQALVVGLAQRVARIQNKAWTIGSGGIDGLVDRCALTLTGGAGVLGYDDLMSLFTALDPVWFEDLENNPPRWMFLPATWAQILKQKDGDGLPLVRHGNELLGFPVEFNPHMPTVATGNVPVLFGRFDMVKVRDVGEMRFIRSFESVGAVENDRYACWAALRSDCGLLVPDSARNPLQGLKVS